MSVHGDESNRYQAATNQSQDRRSRVTDRRELKRATDKASQQSLRAILVVALELADYLRLDIVAIRIGEAMAQLPITDSARTGTIDHFQNLVSDRVDPDPT
jgi:hypothetical protein